MPRKAGLTAMMQPLVALLALTVVWWARPILSEGQVSVAERWPEPAGLPETDVRPLICLSSSVVPNSGSQDLSDVRGLLINQNTPFKILQK